MLLLVLPLVGIVLPEAGNEPQSMVNGQLLPVIVLPLPRVKAPELATHNAPLFKLPVRVRLSMVPNEEQP